MGVNGEVLARPVSGKSLTSWVTCRPSALALLLPGNTPEYIVMPPHTITSKGQVTIPKQVRQQLGIRQGSEVEFTVVGDHVELRVVQQPTVVPVTGFGLLKSKRRSAPADLDPATLAQTP